MTSSRRPMISLACGLALAVVSPSQADGPVPNVVLESRMHPVPKVIGCSAGDHPEPALQGQIPAAMRTKGFAGFNCNLTLESRYVGNGGALGFGSIADDHGHYCAYYSNGLGPVGPGSFGGTTVVDVTDPANAQLTVTLTTPGMMNPWESLRVSGRRQLLAAVSGASMGAPDSKPGILDVYDLAADCRYPKLLASVELGTGVNGGLVTPNPIRGHESNFSPDGLTFYSADAYGKTYSAIDLTDAAKPKVIAQLDMSGAALGASAHGLSITEDGNRGYFVSVALPKAADLADPNAIATDGFYVVDTSEVQARRPDARMRVLSHVAFKNSAGGQHTLSIRVAGKPYVVFVTEVGSGGVPMLGGASAQAACSAGLSPFPMARIVDVSDESKPTLISELPLETHAPSNCDRILPDLTGEIGVTYGSHTCSVDNRANATALACSYGQSGMRVFDIRNPASPREIAYFNPAPAVQYAPGGASSTGYVNTCVAPAGFDFERKVLTTMCIRSGALVLRFTHGVWPMPQSTPPPRTVSYN